MPTKIERQQDDSTTDPALYWEERYAARPVWSGHPNPAFCDVVKSLPVGDALDLGCGEGADVLWLARRGWDALGVDISQTAVKRARAAAAKLPSGPAFPGFAHFAAADLSTWLARARVENVGPFDLVTASFLQSPVHLDRIAVLRDAAEFVRPGGHILAISHFTRPPWAPPLGGGQSSGSLAHAGNGARAANNDGRGANVAHHHAAGHEHQGSRGPDAPAMPTPWGEVLDLSVPAGRWSTQIAEVRPRQATGPGGQRAELQDTVVLLRRER